MGRRSLVLMAVFAGTFAASYLLAAAGQLPADWGGPETALATGLELAVLLTIGVVLNWWFWRILMSAARTRTRGSRAASDAHCYSAIGAASMMGGHSSPVDCSGGAGSFGGDCGAGGV
jgi:hypothetical protein